MAILKDIKLAVNCYLEHAFPGELPKRAHELLETLNSFKNDTAFWCWEFLEIEGDRTSMRWGNNWYPHMKLIFRGNTKENLLFYVDAHDKHFSLPPQFEDRLALIREKNQATKLKIEAQLQEHKLSIMSASKGMKIQYEPLALPVDVLAIDDEKHILNLIQIFVSKIGATSVTCLTVDEAIEKLQSGYSPNIILCDIMMPEKSGYFFYDWLKENGYSTPFYFVTGLGKESVRMQDVPIIQKPFKVCDLHAVIQNYIQSVS